MRFKEWMDEIPDLRGEYWITGHTVLFADGDIGDMNHEGYALEAIQQDILDRFGEEDWESFIDSHDYD